MTRKLEWGSIAPSRWAHSQSRGITTPASVTSAVGLVFGFEVAFGAGPGYAMTFTAWGQWVALARIWLPLSGRLPWAVVAFLEDAYRRGALRQVGAVYQFRHARLQDYLAQRLGGEPEVTGAGPLPHGHQQKQIGLEEG